MGFPPLGALLTSLLGFLATLFLDLRRRRLSAAALLHQPLLATLDLLAPALTAAGGCALLAVLYPEARRTGVLPLQTPAVLALVLCIVVLPVFWFEGRKQIQFQRPYGLLFAEWLVFAGAARILLAALFPAQSSVSLLRAALYAAPSLLAGAALILVVVPPFMKKYEGLRILERVGERVSERADVPASAERFAQPEYTPATPECPQPELWHMLDSQSTEVEVLDFLRTLVTTVKPKLIVETGTFLGHGTMKLAEGARENGFGKVITVEFDPAIRARAVENFQAAGLGPWIESRLESSLDTVIDGTIDLLFSDSHLANREAEIRRLLPQLDPRGLLVIHDSSSHFRLVREAALRLEAEGLISAVLLSTPRGVVMAQRREGRR